MNKRDKKPDTDNLEITCETCDGSGRTRDDSGWSECGHCMGTGYLPTALGEKILSLVRHNKSLVLR